MKKVLVVIVIILIIIGGGYWLFRGGGLEAIKTANLTASSTAGQLSDSAAASGQSEALTAAAAELAAAPLTETYEDPTYGFSLKYPSGLTQTTIPADSGTDSDSGDSSQTGDMILFDNGSGLGFQIIVSPFTEPDADITPDRIKQDIPDMVINQPQSVDMGAGRGKGTTFLDGDPSKPDTNRQIWFAANGYLYQITAMPIFDKAMQRILATWQIK